MFLQFGAMPRHIDESLSIFFHIKNVQRNRLVLMYKPPQGHGEGQTGSSGLIRVKTELLNMIVSY